MEGQEYLNQISATNRPVKGSGASKLFSSKWFWISGIAVIVLILIIIIASALGGDKDGSEKNTSFTLKLHLSNTSEMISKYQPDIKSSSLRSDSASLGSVIATTDKDLGDYLVAKYKFKEKDVNKKIANAAQLNKDGLDSELFNAKINGILDRVYAHKMAYEISVLMTEESKVVKATKDEGLKEALSRSYTSLEELYSKFNDFSETK